MKTLAEADQPREKLLLQGRRALTDAELLAILIRSGSRNEIAVQLCQRILSAYQHDLFVLGGATLEELSRFKGVGKVKAMSVLAALELGRRRQELPRKYKQQITSSRDAFELMQPMMADLQHEEFWILILDTANRLICRQMISKGGRAGTVADPKIIFKTALEHQGSFLILVHNHPSGNLEPSRQDIEITGRLTASGRLLDLPVLDHLIISSHDYCSLADQGMI